jgi:hypothetical protein
MKISILARLLSMTVCAGMPACVAEEPTEDVDSSVLSEQQQLQVDVCPAAFGCVLTAIRDDHPWLIDTCIAVLCPT